MRASVADRNIDASEGRNDILNEYCDLRRISHVGGERFRAPDAIRRRIEFGLVTSRNRNLAAFIRELRRDGQPDTAAATGDQRDLIVEAQIHGAYPNT